MAAIDVGAEAINRGATLGSSTIISKDNPANLSGTITQVEIYTNSELTNVEVAIFEEVSPDTFTTRSNVTLGTVAAGYTSHVVSLAVVAGDYIGIFHSGGIDKDNSGGAGVWNALGLDKIPCTNELFGTFYANNRLSLKGTGAEAGWSGKVGGVTNPAKVIGIAVANITKVSGVS